MAKKCVICGNDIGMLGHKAMIKDGCVCGNCLVSAGIERFENAYMYDQNSARALLETRRPMADSFSPVKIIKLLGVTNIMSVDDTHQLFALRHDIFKYENLLTYELLEDGTTISKGGLGRAVAGGLMFGTAGAIIGGATGKRKAKNFCNSMQIRVTLKDTYADTLYIKLISNKVSTSNYTYKGAQDAAQSCISVLENIIDINSAADTAGSPEVQTLSAADEIFKFKQLMDAGIITPEEFNAKKTQLLGL